MKFSVGVVALLASLCIVDFSAGQLSNTDNEFENSITQAFSSLPGPIANLLKLVAPNLVSLLAQTIKCAQDTVANFNICNLNTTIDPFVIAKACAKNTGLDKVAEAIEKLTPNVTLPIGIPEDPAQSRCFDPTKLLKTLNLGQGLGQLGIGK